MRWLFFGAQSRVCPELCRSRGRSRPAPEVCPASYAPAAAALSPQRSWRSLRTTVLGVFLQRASQPSRPRASPQTYVLAALYLLEDANLERRRLFGDQRGGSARLSGKNREIRLRRY